MVTVPAGEYFVGDPCYAFKDAWSDIVDQFFTHDGDERTAHVNGALVAAVHTAHGDGTYTGDDGFEYPVDAGILGVVPVAVAEVAPNEDMAQRVTFDTDFEVYIDEAGRVTIGHIEIPTDDHDEDDEDLWGDEEEEW